MRKRGQLSIPNFFQYILLVGFLAALAPIISVFVTSVNSNSAVDANSRAAFNLIVFFLVIGIGSAILIYARPQKQVIG